METSTKSPSLLDCVTAAQKWPCLRYYSFQELARLYFSYAPQNSYAVVDEAGELIGTAIALQVDDESVRIPFIATNGSKAAMSALVARLLAEFDGAKYIKFKRRNNECTFAIENLERLLTLKLK